MYKASEERITNRSPGHPPQIQALDKATAGKTDAISQTVQKAVSEEEKRRAEEQEKERRKRCQQAGKNDCV
jgi:hypothetical protein